MKWDIDWIHYGTESEIKFHILKTVIADRLRDNELLLIHGRTTSGQITDEQVIDKTKPLLGKENFQIWTSIMDKVIQFNKIGILRIGERINSKMGISTDRAVFTTKFVLEENKTITYVTHDLEDGAWQFFSEDEFENFEEVAKVVGFKEIMDKDPTLRDLTDMKPGQIATRKFNGDAWVIKEAE